MMFKMQKVLFIVDDFYPMDSAPAVRINSFIEPIFKDAKIHVLGGARKKLRTNKYKFYELKRPSEKNPIAFMYFLFKINLKTIKLAKKGNYDAIILSIPKYELLFCFPYLKKYTNNLILDIRDSYRFLNYTAYFSHFFPKGIAKTLGGFVKKDIIGKILKKSLKKADRISVANIGIKNMYKRFEEKIEVISNGVNTDIFVPGKGKETSSLNLVYLGNFAEKDRFDSIFSILPTFKEKIHLHLIGGGRNKYKILDKLKKAKIPFTDYGLVEHTKLPEILKSMDMGFIFRDKEVEESIPVSLYEFMSMNIPIFTNAVGLMGDFVKKNKAGFVVETKESFEKNLKKIVDDPSILLDFERLHKFALKKFSRKKQAKNFKEKVLKL
jgi:glycosyltransferase involved in cell wall biosynthesis